MVTNLFLSVLEISISVGFIVLILIIFSPLLNKRYAAKWKYWVWFFLALHLIIPVSGTDIRAMAAEMLQKAAGTEADGGTEGAGAALDGTELTGRVIIEIPEQMTMPLGVPSEKRNIRVTALDVAAGIWLIGCLFFLLVHLLVYLHYQGRLMKSGTVLKNKILLSHVWKLKRELKIKKKISVVESPEAASPMIIGIFRTRLILPEEEYGEEELFFILKHELVHLRHKDLYCKLLFVIANAIHWFNPCIWLLQKEAAVDMELYCDESVIRGVNYAGRKAYTEAMLSTLNRQCVKRTALSTQFYGGKRIMQRRFKNILSKKRKKNGLAILVGAILLSILLGAMIGCSGVRENDRGDAAGGGEESAARAESSQPDAEGRRGAEEESATETDANRSGMENGRFAQMEGRWVIDFTVTDSSLWGSGISYGNEMEIAASGEFRYYIGIGVGGTGRCEETDEGITVTIQPYEDNLTEPEILSLKYVNQEGDESIQMDWHGEAVRWRREENAEAVLSDNNAAAAGQMREKTANLTFMVEGEEEQIPATLVTGEGYSFYLPDNEWQQSEPDTWTASMNEQVRFWILHQNGKTLDQVEQELSGSGFTEVYDRTWQQMDEMIYGVELKVLEGDVWGVYYHYPADMEEGWGRRILAIGDTLAAAEEN